MARTGQPDTRRAAEEARLSGRGIAWTANSSAYRFWRAADDASWNEIRDSDLLRPRTLPVCGPG